MPRPHLKPGTYGEIWTSDSGQPYKARARYCDRDGVTRTIARFGQTKAEARERLRAALAERQEKGRIDNTTTVRQLAALWLADVDASSRAARTKEHYRYIAERNVLPAIGALRVSDVTTRVCDRALKDIAARSRSEARSARAVMNGIFRMAVAHDALTVNPVRETTPIAGQRSLARALTAQQAEHLSDRLRTDPRALPPGPKNKLGLDLADLADLMLMTGCRIGEALACRDMLNDDGEPLIDFDAGTWEINATVIRIKGQGLLIQERPKSAAGHRKLALPPSALLMLRRRLGELRLRPATIRVVNDRGITREVDGAPVVFPSPFSRALRDPSNLAADLREVVDRIDCPVCDGKGDHRKDKGVPRCPGVGPYSQWVRSHTFRKSVATRLDEAGWTPRQSADQLGHSDPNLTQSTYYGRKVANPDAARVLDR